MGVSVKEVENLNKRIEVLNTERTKREARKGMLKEQLLKEISKYKDKYGVDLGSENLREMQEKIQKEANSIEAQVEAEYALKKKVVECLEDRDYDGAKRLLGIEDPVEDAADTLYITEPAAAKAKTEHTTVLNLNFNFCLPLPMIF